MAEVREMQDGSISSTRILDELDACVDDIRGSAALLASAGVVWGEQQACGVLVNSMEEAALRLEKIMDLLEKKGCAVPE